MAEKNFMDILFSNQNKLLAYYKGYSLAITDDSYLYKNLEVLTDKMIQNGLDNNISISDQIRLYFEQLETIKINMVANKNKSIILDRDEEILWFLNISSLLKLKVLPNDNMNGFMYIQNQV